MSKRSKILVISIIAATSLTLHYYQLLWAPYLGHSHFIHVIHGRLCYIPIIIGAVWFGLRGGFLVGSVISLFSLLYIILMPPGEPHEVIGEYTEIVFYLALGGLAGVLLDREQAVRRKKEEAEQRLRHSEKLWTVGQMAASIAHEIKNPLGSIRGAAHILQDPSTLPEEKNEFAAIIERESVRLDTVVNDFLAYSRPSPPKITRINMNEMLKAIQKQLSYQANKNGVKIAIQSKTDDAAVKGDADRLHQVLLNVVINAIQAMPNGGRIDIDCLVHKNSGNEKIVVDISDSGPGIAPEHLKRIFEPFYSTKDQGTGLGLITAREIIFEHKGNIEVESIVGKGTIFHIILPSDGNWNAYGTT
jgi:signal transduction histidine kinase